MLFKFLMIVMMAVLFPFPSEASSENCPPQGWVKLNKSPVCFGAKGDSYGTFSYPGNIFVSSFMFVYRSGSVTNRISDKDGYSYWGGRPYEPPLGAILTDDNNNILAPEASTVSENGWYTLSGYTSSASALVFPAAKKQNCVHANSELRLWYGEDLTGFTESDNEGTTCADVYGLLLEPASPGYALKTSTVKVEL